MKEFFKIKSKKANRARIQVITIAVSLMLVAAIAIGGTVAWLIDTTDPVTNTLTYGMIDIELTETDSDNDGNTLVNKYPTIPGATVIKDPKVIVKKNSENCYLFVKIEKLNNFDAFMDYTPATGWTQVPNVADVYYRTVDQDTTKDQEFPILLDDQISVKGSVTQAQISALTDNTLPTVKFTAYAIQRQNLVATEVYAIWDLVKNETAKYPQP